MVHYESGFGVRFVHWLIIYAAIFFAHMTEALRPDVLAQFALPGNMTFRSIFIYHDGAVGLTHEHGTLQLSQSNLEQAAESGYVDDQAWNSTGIEKSCKLLRQEEQSEHIKSNVASFCYGQERFFVTINNATGCFHSELRQRTFNFTGTEDVRLIARLSCNSHDGRRFHEATAAMVIADYLYVSFFEQDPKNERNSSSVVCRYVFPKSSVLEKNHAHWTERAQEFFPGTRLMAMTTSFVDNRHILITQEIDRVRVISISTVKPPRTSSHIDLVLLPSSRPQTKLLDHITAVTVGQNSEDFFMLTERQVLKFDLNRCSRLTTCSSCIGTQHKDTHCGWCVLENRCSPLSACASAFDDRNPTMEGKLWLKDFIAHPRQCPNTKRYEDVTSYAIDTPNWKPNDVKIEFLAVNIPPNGLYQADLQCTYRYGQTNRSDTTTVTFKPQTDEAPARFACTNPPSMVERAIQSRSNFSSLMTVRVALSSRKSSRALSETELILLNCGSMTTCFDCGTSLGRCVWLFETSMCTAVSGEIRVLSENRCPPQPTARPATSSVPIFTFNFPTACENCSVLRLTFSGNYLDSVQENLRDLRITLEETECLVVIKPLDQAVECEMRDMAWTGRASVRIRYNGWRVACNKCWFERLPARTPSVGKTRRTTNEIRRIRPSTSHEIDTVTMILIPVVMAFGLLCLVLAVGLRVRAMSQKSDQDMEEFRALVTQRSRPMEVQRIGAASTYACPSQTEAAVEIEEQQHVYMKILEPCQEPSNSGYEIPYIIPPSVSNTGILFAGIIYVMAREIVYQQHLLVGGYLICCLSSFTATAPAAINTDNGPITDACTFTYPSQKFDFCDGSRDGVTIGCDCACSLATQCFKSTSPPSKILKLNVTVIDESEGDGLPHTSSQYDLPRDLVTSAVAGHYFCSCDATCGPKQFDEASNAAHLELTFCGGVTHTNYVDKSTDNPSSGASSRSLGPDGNDSVGQVQAVSMQEDQPVIGILAFLCAFCVACCLWWSYKRVRKFLSDKGRNGGYSGAASE
ncbi:hypothetical protein BV898_00224 [Hypsibius exemplaris]|uniref:PSI domain-containing protein n=1 Tax=Hypsibius exemplaris TaxID=2072580 RepID=A0A1W0XFC3_HYPEX|nr:hypothetical protein BV898_00224 [Hypsibius exemplaris]